jgi:hypothetical protein
MKEYLAPVQDLPPIWNRVYPRALIASTLAIVEIRRLPFDQRFTTHPAAYRGHSQVRLLYYRELPTYNSLRSYQIAVLKPGHLAEFTWTSKYLALLEVIHIADSLRPFGQWFFVNPDAPIEFQWSLPRTRQTIERETRDIQSRLRQLQQEEELEAEGADQENQPSNR